jgi:hypothetical protein
MVAVQNAFFVALNKGLPKIKMAEEKEKLSKALLFGLKSDEIPSGPSHEAICHKWLFQCIARREATHRFQCTSPGETFVQYAQELKEHPNENAFLNFCNALSLVTNDPSVVGQIETIEKDVNELLITLLPQATSLDNLLEFMGQALLSMNGASLNLSETSKEAIIAQLERLVKDTTNHKDFEKLCTLFQKIELTPDQQERVAKAAGVILHAEILEAKTIQDLILPASGLSEMGSLPLTGLKSPVFKAIVAQAKTIAPSLAEFPALKTLFDTLTPHLTPDQQRAFTQLSLERVAKAAQVSSPKAFLESCQESIGHLILERPKEKELPLEAKDFSPIASGLSTVWTRECQELVKKGKAVLSGTGIGKEEDIKGVRDVLEKEFSPLEAQGQEFSKRCPESVQKGVNVQMTEAIGAGFLPIGTKLLEDLQDKTRAEVEKLTANREVNKKDIKTAVKALKGLRASLSNASKVISAHTDAEKKRVECVKEIDRLIEQLEKKEEKKPATPGAGKPVPEIAAGPVEVLREATVEGQAHNVKVEEAEAAAEPLVEEMPQSKILPTPNLLVEPQPVATGAPPKQIAQLSLARRVYHAVAPCLQILTMAGLQASMTGGGVKEARDIATSYLFMNMVSDTIGRIAIPLFSRALQFAGISRSVSTTIAQAATASGTILAFRWKLGQVSGKETTLLAAVAAGIKAIVTQKISGIFKGRAQEVIDEHLDEGLLSDVVNDMAGAVCTAMTGVAVDQAEAALKEVGAAASSALQRRLPVVDKTPTKPAEASASKTAKVAEESGLGRPQKDKAAAAPIGSAQDLTGAASARATTPPQATAVQQLFDMYQKALSALPAGQRTGIASMDVGRRYEESLRSGNIQPFLEWFQTTVAAQQMPAEASDQAGLADAAHQVLGMSVEQLGDLLSDLKIKNPLGLSAKEVAADFAAFVDIMAFRAPMALFSFASPLVGDLVQTFGGEGIGILQQPESFLSPLGEPPSMGIPLSGPSPLTS